MAKEWIQALIARRNEAFSNFHYNDEDAVPVVIFIFRQVREIPRKSIKFIYRHCYRYQLSKYNIVDNQLTNNEREIFEFSSSGELLRKI